MPGPVPQIYPYCRWLLYGLPGSLKSTLASTFPTPGLLLCFDGYLKEAPYLERGIAGEVQCAGEGMIPYRDVLWEDGSLLWRVLYFHEETPRTPRAYQTFHNYFMTLTYQAREPFHTVVLDSATSCQTVAFYDQKYRIQPTAKDGRKWYGGVAEVMQELIYTQLGGWTNCNTVVIAHVGTEMDEGTGGWFRKIDLPGKLSGRVAGNYPELYRHYAVRDTMTSPLQYGVQTSPLAEFNAFSNFCHAPNPSVPDYQALWGNYKGQVVTPGPTTPTGV